MLFSEPKIPQSHQMDVCRCLALVFQCSSASRKFLNLKTYKLCLDLVHRFSALQRAENSSICGSECAVGHFVQVSVLFSEPKIPQSDRARRGAEGGIHVSVLFSEPKIPQCVGQPRGIVGHPGFSALQRAENSSMFRHLALSSEIKSFSALQRAENSSIHLPTVTSAGSLVRFSALQRAENSSIRDVFESCGIGRLKFQCSSASRKFLNHRKKRRCCVVTATFQCSSASRKFLNPDPRTCVHPYFRPR